MTPTIDPYREWDAAYVLGALGPAERRYYEQHLQTCDACREAVAELAGMPGLLAALTPEQAAGLLEEPEPGPGVVPLAQLATAVRRSRVRRRSLAAVAAAALVVGGVLGGVALAGGPSEPGPPDAGPSSSAPSTATPSSTPTATDPGAQTVSLLPVGAADVRATLTATPTDWGTRLEWSCAYGTAGTVVPRDGYGGEGTATYELVLVDRDGGRTVVATWAATGAGSTGLGATSALRLPDVERVEIAMVGIEEPLASAVL
jgi:hypothetical protein